MTEPRTTGETRRASPKEEAEALGERRLALEERAEEEAAGALATTLEELLALDAEHRRAHEKAYAAEASEQSVGVFTRTFAPGTLSSRSAIGST